MKEEFIDITAENIGQEHLCCIIRKKPHPGVERKRQWLAARLREGHTFRKLNVNGCCFIEYAPLEKAWVPIEGKNYLYIYCLWTQGGLRGHGYSKALMESCIADAKKQGRDGVCMLGSAKQKNWLSDQAFAKSFGFRTVDATDYGYEVLALTFAEQDAAALSSPSPEELPHFSAAAKAGRIDEQALTIYYSDQCPYIDRTIDKIRQYCKESDTTARLIHIDTLEMAKAVPGAFNNWAVFYGGAFKTVNLLDLPSLQRLLKG